MGKLVFTEATTQTFRAASHLAAAEGSSKIRDEHLLLSIFRSEREVGRTALIKLGVSPATVETKLGLEDISTDGTSKEAAQAVYDASKERLVELTSSAAHIALGRFGTNDIQPEHLLLALAPKDGTPANELINWGYGTQTTTTEALGVKFHATSQGQRPLEAAVIEAHNTTF